MLVIGFGQRKGGVGKTTLCFNLAVAAAAESGKSVAIVDTDPQRSMRAWVGASEEPRTDIELFANEDDAVRAVEKLERAGTFDLVFIDSEGHGLEQLHRLAQACHYLVMPVRASALDLASAATAVVEVEKCGTPYAFCLNFVSSDERKNVAVFRKEIEAQRVRVLTTEVHQRPSYHLSVGGGRAAGEMPGAHLARKEMAALWLEVQKLARAGQRAKPRQERANVG